MEFIKKESIIELSNPGVISRQLINPENSKSERVTITEVHLKVGSIQPRHKHETSEQIWYAIHGTGKLLLADDKEIPFAAGDVVRFADNDIHGLFNDGESEFVYVSVTTPPLNFNSAYKSRTTNSSFEALWNCADETEWIKALNHYWDMLKTSQVELETYIDSINAEDIKVLSSDGFYDFLYNKYFVWKYTQKNRLASTRKHLRRYVDNDELMKLESIHKRLFALSKDNIFDCLSVANEIYGLGTAGASGLLSILFPQHFGTVDQFVVKRLREIKHPIYQYKLEKMNPESLNNKDGVILVSIMREKAEELNRNFDTNFWTPRKIDMVLWAFGR